ncbi:putative F-box/LRR-repeat protein At3g44810 [Rhodamnia argentea]|uniref:F-box/LRR-repeat protein At3g44810 n=1 Tax=Rhodamnia argentea TaxID=178133 RepID=A0A8B8N3Q0_9MYRT|nr:putative F-box/LRR-repeat protein At3g44810 [Rhodamnia argentea]
MDRNPPVREAGRVGSLCDLPDGLLHHILSFLPLKDVVRTGVLSKKWRNLWAFVPNLAFDELEFPHRKCFFQFVERCLMFRDMSAVNSFSLSCFVRQDVPSIYTWICFAIKHSVQKLHLCLYVRTQPDIRFLVPSQVFRSETLTELHLEIESAIVIPSTALLPKLKVLSLVRVSFKDDQWIGKLLSSVPCLEDLTLQDIFCWHLKEINISAPKLARLYIVQKVFPANIRSINGA